MKDGEVIDIQNTKHFQDTLKKNRHTLIVINFSASWCGPSKMMEEVYSRLAKKYRACVFLHVDTDHVCLVAEDYSISKLPTFVFLKKNNKPAKEWRITGAHSDQLVSSVEKLAKECSGKLFPGQGYSMTCRDRDVGGRCYGYVHIWGDENFVQSKLKTKSSPAPPNSEKDFEDRPENSLGTSPGVRRSRTVTKKQRAARPSLGYKKWNKKPKKAVDFNLAELHKQNRRDRKRAEFI